MSQITESAIAHHLAMVHWSGRHLAMIRNCHAAAGHESDLLVVNEKRRVIDIEIKISRADFKADAKKTKWRESLSAHEAALTPGSIETDHEQAFSFRGQKDLRRWKTYHVPLLYPKNVWKHYFCMPADIWDDDLIEYLPSPASGVMLVHHADGRIWGSVKTIRPAKANPDFKILTSDQILNIARLCTIRMWAMSEKLRESEK